MKVIKRSGTTQEYDGKKITSAMQKAFDSVGQTCRQEVLRDLLSQVEQNLGEGPPHSGGNPGYGGADPHGKRIL